MPTVEWSVEGDTDVVEAAGRVSSAHQQVSREGIALQRGNLMVGRSFLMMGALGVRGLAQLTSGNKELHGTLNGISVVLGITSAAMMGYNMLLRVQGLLHKRNTVAIVAETGATRSLTQSKLELTAASVRQVGAGGASGGAGLLGRLGMSGGALAGGVGGGLLAGALGAEFLAPAIVLALRGKDPFGEEYKTFSQIVGGRAMPPSQAAGMAFSQSNVFNAPMTGDMMRQLDDANKRGLRQFGES